MIYSCCFTGYSLPRSDAVW